MFMSKTCQWMLKICVWIFTIKTVFFFLYYTGILLILGHAVAILSVLNPGIKVLIYSIEVIVYLSIRTIYTRGINDVISSPVVWNDDYGKIEDYDPRLADDQGWDDGNHKRAMRSFSKNKSKLKSTIKKYTNSELAKKEKVLNMERHGYWDNLTKCRMNHGGSKPKNPMIRCKLPFFGLVNLYTERRRRFYFSFWFAAFFLLPLISIIYNLHTLGAIERIFGSEFLVTKSLDYFQDLVDMILSNIVMYIVGLTIELSAFILFFKFSYGWKPLFQLKS